MLGMELRTAVSMKMTLGHLNGVFTSVDEWFLTDG